MNDKTTQSGLISLIIQLVSISTHSLFLFDYALGNKTEEFGFISSILPDYITIIIIGLSFLGHYIALPFILFFAVRAISKRKLYQNGNIQQTLAIISLSMFVIHILLVFLNILFAVSLLSKCT